jgi:TrpR-related protein YerC/YecD
VIVYYHTIMLPDAPRLTDAEALFEAILGLRDAEECRRFFSDLCTPAEVMSLTDRWRVAKLLAQGMPYRSIYEKTGVSTATVTRVARALTYGEKGYELAIERAAKKT